MMQLTDEMNNLGNNNKDYILLNKIMPVTDDLLDNYINTINELSDNGVNICKILDYKLITDDLEDYNDTNAKYIKGLFLCEKAKGVSLDNINFLNIDDDKMIDYFVDQYIIELEKYIEELEKRSSVEQIIYDKLISDCLNILNKQLMIDLKTSNFFFDEKIGYTIMNLIPLKDADRFYNELPMYIAFIIFGYGRPAIYMDHKLLNYMSKELHDRLFKATNKIIKKFKNAFNKYNISNEKIKEALYYINDSLMVDNMTIIQKENIHNKILEKKD